MTTITKPTKTELIKELRHAYEAKGSKLASTDADHQLYGLRYKNAYVEAFGSWNAAVSRAGLPTNPWKGGRTKGTPNTSYTPAETVEVTALEQHLANKLEKERQEIAVLERMLTECRHIRRVAG